MLKWKFWLILLTKIKSVPINNRDTFKITRTVLTFQVLLKWCWLCSRTVKIGTLQQPESLDNRRNSTGWVLICITYTQPTACMQKQKIHLWQLLCLNENFQFNLKRLNVDYFLASPCFAQSWNTFQAKLWNEEKRKILKIIFDNVATSLIQGAERVWVGRVLKMKRVMESKKLSTGVFANLICFGLILTGCDSSYAWWEVRQGEERWQWSHHQVSKSNLSWHFSTKDIVC